MYTNDNMLNDRIVGSKELAWNWILPVNGEFLCFQLCDISFDQELSESIIAYSVNNMLKDVQKSPRITPRGLIAYIICNYLFLIAA